MTRLIPTNTKREDCVQTPIEYAQAIIEHFKPIGRTLEPCSGDGNFLKVYPFTASCEILKGSDFFDEKETYNWIITNPPYSKMRKFIQHSMKIADNIVFLTTINHLWLKARIRDIEQAGYGIREIVIFDTPKTFPPSGFQIGCFYLQKGYVGDIKYSKLIVGNFFPTEHIIAINQNPKTIG